VPVLFIAAGLSAVLYLSIHRRVPTTRGPRPLAAAPAIILTDLSGNTINPSSYKGKVVLINFWAAWCTPCRDEIPQFVALEEKYRARGFQSIGVSMDDPESTLRDFCREYKVNYPVITGNQKIAEEFGGVLGLPTTFLIGRDGLIHARYAGTTDFPKLEQEIATLLDSR
jgi:peroxiredoxin